MQSNFLLMFSIPLFLFFRYFDSRFEYSGYLPRLNFWSAFGDRRASEILGEASHLTPRPSPIWWSTLRTIVVMAPVVLIGQVSPGLLATIATPGLILLVSPLRLPGPDQLIRPTTLGAKLGLMLAGTLNNFLYLGIGTVLILIVGWITGFKLGVSWLLPDLHLFPQAIRPDSLRDALWIAMVLMLFLKTMALAKVTMDQGEDPSEYEPLSRHLARRVEKQKNYRNSKLVAAFVFSLGTIALYFAYNYTALLDGYKELGGHLTASILTFIVLLLRHPF